MRRTSQSSGDRLDFAKTNNTVCALFGRTGYNTMYLPIIVARVLVRRPRLHRQTREMGYNPAGRCGGRAFGSRRRITKTVVRKLCIFQYGIVFLDRNRRNGQVPTVFN